MKEMYAKANFAYMYILNPNVACLQVIWNAPTESCKRDYGVDVNVTKYGILENPVDGWHGPTVVVVG